MRLLQWLCVRSVRLPAVVVLMLALLVGVESKSLAQDPQPSLTVSPLSPESERALQPKDSFAECAQCPEMVVVPAGSFLMGSPPKEKDLYDEEGQKAMSVPQHQVTIAKPFAVGKFEVTFDDWDACVADGDCPHANDSGLGRGRRPVINVSWDDAQLYVAWLSRVTGKTYRLLSEAEWEYAARAGTQTVYFWGDEIGTGTNANCQSCGSKWDGRQTAPVGSFAGNAFGLHDLHGNVWEWVEDCRHGNYEGAPDDGSAWMAGGLCDSRVLRGGSWYYPPLAIRSAVRGSETTETRAADKGFRVGRTLTP